MPPDFGMRVPLESDHLAIGNNNYRQMKDFKGIYRTEGAYHRHTRGFKAWFLQDNYSAIAAECSNVNMVLDLACGEGCLGSHLSARTLIGIDYSEEALCLNRELYPHVYDELYLGDLRHLDRIKLSEASFDAVACSLSLMYLLPEDLKNCLRYIDAFLISGGVFVCTYPTVGPYRKGSLEAAELTPAELTGALIEAGFVFEKMIPICPLVPRHLVEQSQHTETEETAYKEYSKAKNHMTLETSYHFLCKVRKE